MMLLPASAAIVGVYAQVDDSRGVWKAPANVNIIDGIDLEVKITNSDQGQSKRRSNWGFFRQRHPLFSGRGHHYLGSADPGRQRQ